MTGTGTQTDPYIATNADELIEATSVAEGGDVRCVKLGADINMDGHVNVDMHFYELDGDGHSITNINVENTNGLNIHVYADNATIKNISFVSCSALINGSIITFSQEVNGTWATNIYNCTFSLKLTNTSNFGTGMWLAAAGGSSVRRLTVVVERCVADVTYTSSNYMRAIVYQKDYGSIDIKWSHIKINAKITKNNGGDTYLFTVEHFDHCYITGQIEWTTQEGSYNGSAILYARSGYNTAYAAIHGTNTKVPIFRDGIMNGVVFYDGDIYATRSDSRFKCLTTAQCKDIDYLNSIGFDVVPGE